MMSGLPSERQDKTAMPACRRSDTCLSLCCKRSGTSHSCFLYASARLIPGFTPFPTVQTAPPPHNAPLPDKTSGYATMFPWPPDPADTQQSGSLLKHSNTARQSHVSTRYMTL